MIVAVSFPKSRKFLIDSPTKQDFAGRLEGNILHVWDAIDSPSLIGVINRFGTPKYIVMDSFSYCKFDIDVPVYYIDAWIEYQLHCGPIDKPANVRVDHCANFIINKKQINRFLAIKLCEIFDIDVNYTWSGIGKDFDLSHVVQEKQSLEDATIDSYWGKILSPITKFDKNWYSSPGETFGHGGVDNYGDNITLWNSHFKHIVSNSAVSIITESVTTQEAITFSEKTAYAVLGLTFPIWIGGMHQATYWKAKGFDTFDDIIDHSYQTLPTLIERCFYALYLNREILTSKDRAADLRQANLDRLLHNRNLLVPDTFKKYNQSIISQWPEELQQPGSNSIAKYLPHLTSYL